MCDPAAVFESLAYGRSASLQEITWAVNEQTCLMAVPFSPALCPPPPPQTYLQCQQSLSDIYKSPAAVNHTGMLSVLDATQVS